MNCVEATGFDDSFVSAIMDTTVNNYYCDRLTEVFTNMIPYLECYLCKASYSEVMENLVYNQGCMHIVCKKCSPTASNNCPLCDDTSFSLVVSRHRLNILVSSIFMDARINLDSEDSNVIFFTCNDFPIKKSANGENILHKLSRKGDLDELKQYLDKGVDPNTQDFGGWTPMHEAIRIGNTKAAEVLLGSGALLDVPAISYQTPLISALLQKNIGMVEFLVRNGASLKCVSNVGFTVFDFCCNYEMLRALCLTRRNNSNFSVFKIPKPKIVFLKENEVLIKVASNNDNLTVCNLSDLSKPGAVNYLVMEDIDPHNKHVQLAILQGVLVVELKWCLDFIRKEKQINPLDYLVNTPGFSFSKSALNMFNLRPKLFSEINFYFIIKKKKVSVNNFKYTLDDLIELVKAGGGTVLNRSPIKRPGDVLKYPYHANKNSSSATVNLYTISNRDPVICRESYIDGILVRSVKWLVYCINSFTIIPDPI